MKDISVCMVTAVHVTSIVVLMHAGTVHQNKCVRNRTINDFSLSDTDAILVCLYHMHSWAAPTRAYDQTNSYCICVR